MVFLFAICGPFLFTIVVFVLFVRAPALVRRPLLSFVAERAFIAFSAYRASIELGS